MMNGPLRQTLRTIFYDCAERFRPSVEITLNGERYRVPLRWRRFFYKDYELSTFEFIRQYCKPGSTLLDIGAHFGIFTILGARAVGVSGKVIALEPCAQTRRVFADFLRLNPVLAKIDLRTEAVSARSGATTFFASSIRGDVANSLIPNDAHGIATSAHTVALDDLEYPRIDVIKIDAEGAEQMVLEGGAQMIRRVRPPVLLSVHPQQIVRNGGSLKGLWQTVIALGLEPYFAGTPIDQATFCGQTDLFDVVLLPSASAKG